MQKDRLEITDTHTFQLTRLIIGSVLIVLGLRTMNELCLGLLTVISGILTILTQRVHVIDRANMDVEIRLGLGIPFSDTLIWKPILWKFLPIEGSDSVFLKEIRELDEYSGQYNSRYNIQVRSKDKIISLYSFKSDNIATKVLAEIRDFLSSYPLTNKKRSNDDVKEN